MSVNLERLIFIFGCISSSREVTTFIDCIVPIYTVLAITVIYASYVENKFILQNTHINNHINTSIQHTQQTTQQTSQQTPSNKQQQQPATSIIRNPPCPNLTGTYKLVKNINYQDFLECQGVGWALRKAADSANTTHVLTHTTSAGGGGADDTLRLDIKGLISSTVDYGFYQPPITTKIKDKTFTDVVSYLPSSEGVRITKSNDADGYDIIVERRLDGDELTMRQEVVFRDGRRKGKEATQIFKRVA
mmetsp:Transcript_26698/g.53230  ORF Transcript_26698/g.53230 Transcript_26698/m.53230 type:complete len:247 (+) Transcript_26698:219-959(+)